MVTIKEGQKVRCLTSLILFDGNYIRSGYASFDDIGIIKKCNNRYEHEVYFEGRGYSDFLENMYALDECFEDYVEVPSNTTTDILIKYHFDDMPELEMTDKGDWCDLFTAEDIILTNPVEYQLVNLGVSMQLPEGYEANIVPRSSTYKHWNVIQTNSFAVVDETYCGDNDVWKFPLLFVLTNQALVDGVNNQVVIPKHTRLCQFRINKKQPKLNFIKVDSLGNKNRDGIGSSGR